MHAFPSLATAGRQASGESTLMISMRADALVICVPEHLDLETTEVLVDAAASGVACGSTVMIDLDPATAVDELIARRPRSFVTTNCLGSDRGPVEVLGAGLVRLTTRDGYWTIDVGRGRLCRSDDVIEPHFFGPAAWTPVQALWVTPTSITALAGDGTYLAASAAWSIRRRPRGRPFGFPIGHQQVSRHVRSNAAPADG